MTDSTLKTVVVLDPDTQRYKPANHNLTASAALDLSEQFSAEDRSAKILDQEKHHRASDPTKCSVCKKAAEAVHEAESHTQSSDRVAS